MKHPFKNLWTESGPRARGGFDVGLQWKKGGLVEASLRSNLGQPCRVLSAHSDGNPVFGKVCSSSVR